MTPAERLIACARGCGFDVAATDAGPVLRKRRADAALTDVLRAELAAHRNEIAAHLRTAPAADDPECVACAECDGAAFVYGGDRDTAFLACQANGRQTLLCPLWRPGLGPPWFAKDRWFAGRRRAEDAARAEREAEDVPE